MTESTSETNTRIDEMNVEDRRVGEVLDRYLAALEKGEAPAVQQLLNEHAALREVLEPALQKLRELHQVAIGIEQDVNQAGRIGHGTLEGGLLGDFRILREIGRGGMGVVYEAEQISLSRRVALKILPFAAMLDQRQLQRFRNEARAAATLHHPSIVPVFFVGCERGVHFYAMQFIEGQSLADVLEELRSAAGMDAADVSLVLTDAELTDRLSTRTFSFYKSGQRPKGHASSGHHPDTLAPPTAKQTSGPSWQLEYDPVVDQLTPKSFPPQTTRVPQGLASTHSGSKTSQGSAYCRRIAELAIQAAEALQYAHELGVVHRDIKPANLLLDHTGRVWIADFGLARLPGDAGMTMTGDLMGTLRYMSPEQALGNRMVVDHRTDIYSLGATLYELLTLRPAFGGSDRQNVLRRIELDEPTPPRRLDRAIPQDLETIVLTALAKSADERFATAKELADDCRRFLDNMPIKARRATLQQRFTKWSRRHTRALFAGIAVLIVSAIGALFAAVLLGNAYQRESSLRTVSDERQDAAQTNLYVADMRLAMRDWQEGNVLRLRSALNRHVPDRQSKDRRGWEWHFLDSLTRQNKWSFTASGKGVTDVAWSPNGMFIAAAQSDQGVSIVNPLTGKEIDRIGSSSYLVAWDADSTNVVSATRDGKIDIYNVDGERRSSVSVVGQIRGVDLSSDGQRLAVCYQPRDWTAGQRLRLNIINLTTGELAELNFESRVGYKGLHWNFNAAAWNSNDSLLACGCSDQYLRIVDVDAEKIVWTVKAADEIFSAVWSPDDARIATGGFGGRIQVWSAATHECQFTVSVGSAVSNLRWSPDGTRIVGVRQGGAIIVDTTTGMVVENIKGHTGGVRCARWSPDGRQLATCGEDATMLWDLASLQPMKVALEPKPIGDATWSHDNRLVGIWQDGLHVVDSHNGVVRSAMPIDIKDPVGRWRTGDSWSWRGIDGDQVALVQPDGQLGMVRVRDGKVLSQIPLTGIVTAIACSPNGRHVAVSLATHEMQVWEIDRKVLVFQVATMAEQPNSLAWNPSGDILAHSDGWAGTVTLYDSPSWRPRRILKGHPSWLMALRWSSDGRRIAGGGLGGDVWIWNASSGRVVHRLRAHSSFISGIAWSPDNTRLASTAAAEDRIRLWNAITGEELIEIPHPSRPTSVAWSPDGLRLAVTDQEGKLSIWQASKDR